MRAKLISPNWRVFFALLVPALLVNSVGYPPVRAQSSLQFEGIIAYKDSTGNIIFATGSGNRIPATTDADANQNPLERNQQPTYEIFGFSPNGMYLAIKRWSNDEDEVLYIYDVAHGNIAAKLNFGEYRNDSIQGNQGRYHPMQWHQDSDSIIFHQSITEEGHEISYDHQYYYRVYFSGESSLLFDTYSNPHRMNINFDLNTYFESNDGQGVILHNWIENTTYEIPVAVTSTVSGVWTHDGSHFIHVDNESETISIADLKTGMLVKQLQIPGEMWALDGSLQQLHRLVYPPYHYFLLSPDSKHLLLTDENAGLYDFDLETSAIESVYAWTVNHPENEIKALRSSSGNLAMVNTYSGDDQRVLVVKKGNLPVRVATNAEPLFWLSKDSERLVYAQYNVSGDKIYGDLMVYDHATGASIKVGDLPIIKDVDTSSGISYEYYQYSVDWTNGQDLAEAPLTTMTPSDATVTPQLTEAPCPFELAFQEKQGVINSLQNPPQISQLETGFPIPLPFLEPSVWKYDEEEAQKLLDSLRRDCESYANGTMIPYQRDEFETKVVAFKRLTQTEIALNGLFPQYLNTAYAVSKPVSDLLFGSLSIFFSLDEFEKWLSARDTGFGLADLAAEVVKTAKNFILDLVDSFLSRIVALMGDFGEMTHFTFEPVLKIIQFLVDPKEGGLDILNESIAQKLLAGHLVTKYVVLTQSEIDVAVANVPPGSNAHFPNLNMTATDLEAEQAIDTLLQTSNQKTEQTLQTLQSLEGATDSIGLLSGALDLSAKVTLLTAPATGPGAPGTVSLAALLENLSKLMDVLVLVLRGASSHIGISHHNLLTHYAINSADIAFDPSHLNTVLVQENQITNLDVASLDFVPGNYIPASIYYSRYQEQTTDSVDNYKASIGRLIQAVASGQDEQIRIAAEELLKVDDELRISLKIAEAPLTEMPNDRPEVQNLDFSIQDLRAQSVTLHVALATHMVNKDSPEIRQETQIIVTNVLKSADNFKVSYEVMSQSGLAIPAKFLPVILDAKMSDTIVEGDTFLMSVKITNVGQISQQSPVTLSVAGGDKVEAHSNQILPEITPHSQIEIPINLKAKRNGNEFIIVELIQDGNVINSKIVYLEINQSTSIFSLPPASYLVGGGLGLLCLTILTIGGVFFYTRTRNAKRTPAKSAGRTRAVKPVSGSAEQVKRAIELSKAKRYEEAFEILRGIVQAEPNNMSAWFNLGGVLASMGNYKGAERCYLRAKQLGHPRGDDALSWLRQHRK